MVLLLILVSSTAFPEIAEPLLAKLFPLRLQWPHTGARLLGRQST